MGWFVLDGKKLFVPGRRKPFFLLGGASGRPIQSKSRCHVLQHVDVRRPSVDTAVPLCVVHCTPFGIRVPGCIQNATPGVPTRPQQFSRQGGDFGGSYSGVNGNRPSRERPRSSGPLRRLSLQSAHHVVERNDVLSLRPIRRRHALPEVSLAAGSGVRRIRAQPCIRNKVRRLQRTPPREAATGPSARDSSCAPAA
jgi:hypothetical protein